MYFLQNKATKRLTWLVSFIFLLAQNAGAQVVNIEAARIKGKDSVGWFGTLGANFSLIKNTKQITQAEANVLLQRNTVPDIWLLVLRTNILQADNDALTNETFAHLRNTHRLNKWLRTEVFTQVQNNAITRIRLRALGGAGLRFRLVRSPKLGVYTGIAYMYEYTDEMIPNGINTLREHRNTQYFTTTYTPVPNIELIATTYYQPLFADWGKDFRLMGEYRAKFALHKKISFNTQFRFLYDTKPAPTAVNSTYSWLNGIQWTF